MSATGVHWTSRTRFVSLAILGGVTLAGATVTSTAHAQRATPARTTWISFQGSQLCRTWAVERPAEQAATSQTAVRMAGGSATATAVGTLPVLTSARPAPTVTATAAAMTAHATATPIAGMDADGATRTRCTTTWHIAADGSLVSDSPDWVPNPDGQWPVILGADDDQTALAMRRDLIATGRTTPTSPRTSTTLQLATTTATKVIRVAAPPVTVAASVPTSSGATYGSGPGDFTPVPGHPSYAQPDFAGDPNAGTYGVCTWYAWYRRQDEPLATLGMASQWAANAAARGLRTGSAAAAGATVVFQPGVQGAGGGGHAAHVEQVLDNGWFILSEMNFSWNGGGWGRVDWRYAHVGPGVTFIY